MTKGPRAARGSIGSVNYSIDTIGTGSKSSSPTRKFDGNISESPAPNLFYSSARQEIPKGIECPTADLAK